MEDEDLKLLYSLDITSSSGPDDISRKMLKATATSIASSLCKLFDLSNMTCYFSVTTNIVLLQKIVIKLILFVISTLPFYLSVVNYNLLEWHIYMVRS